MAGNFSEKIEEYDEAAINFSDAANVFKELNHSVDIIPETISVMTFSTHKEAKIFARSAIESGHHILEIIDDYGPDESAEVIAEDRK